MISILLINDNKIVSRLLQLSSKKSGFMIEESGVLAPQKEFYNLIFVDSDKYSDELLAQIKDSLTYDKLVFIGTAQAKVPEGFELVLEKPFLPTDFTNLVEKNFILEDNNIDEDKSSKDEDFDNFDNIDLDNEEFDVDNSIEDIAKMVDSIEDIEEKVEQDKKEQKEVEDMEKDEESLPDIEMDKEDLEIEDEEELPDIDEEFDIDEINEVDSKEENSNEQNDDKQEDIKSSEEIKIDTLKKEEAQEKEIQNSDIDEDYKSIDQDEIKRVVGESIEEKDDKNDKDKDLEDLPPKQDKEGENNSDGIEEASKKQEEIINTNGNIEEKLEELISKKLEEIITPDLIKEALKDLNITISLGK